MAIMSTRPEAMIGAAQVLIVVDDAELAAALAHCAIDRLDAEIAVMGSVSEARPLVESGVFDVVVAAQALPDGQGLSLLANEAGVDISLVLLDDELDAGRVLAALRLGAVDVLTQ